MMQSRLATALHRVVEAAAVRTQPHDDAPVGRTHVPSASPRTTWVQWRSTAAATKKLSFMNPPVRLRGHDTQFVRLIQRFCRLRQRVGTAGMSAWISGTHDPQFVPHLRRLPISTAVARVPSSRTQAAMALRPTPKHEHTSGPGSAPSSALPASRLARMAALSLPPANNFPKPGAIRQRRTAIDVNRGLQLLADEPGAAKQQPGRIPVLDPVEVGGIRDLQQASGLAVSSRATNGRRSRSA